MHWDAKPALSGPYALTVPVPEQEQAWACLCPCYVVPLRQGQVSHRSFVPSSRIPSKWYCGKLEKGTGKFQDELSGVGLYSLVFFRDPRPPASLVTHIGLSLNPSLGKGRHPPFLLPVCKGVGGPQHILSFLQNSSLKIFSLNSHSQLCF